MRKSSSLPGIMMLGTTAPKGIDGHYGSKPTLGFRLHHGPVDLHLGPSPSSEALTAAEKLKYPGWRQREMAAMPRPASATALDDVLPKNMRHPRVKPAWLQHDKQVLRFYGFFQETVVERADENSRYRQVNFMYYIEDGTLQITEPKVENSGIPQGAFLKRHRVPRPDGMGVLGPDDFRCGEQIELYGRNYHLTGCDRFTRWFYKENGIDVGEDEPLVKDSWQKSYKYNKTAEKGGLPMSNQAFDAKNMTKYLIGQPPADRKFQQFLLNDRKVLRFKGYWDDQTLYGARFYFVFLYYLADNTVEINEAHSRNSGRDNYPGFYKRAPMYKKNSMNAYPGMLTADGGLYMPEDFSVGESINVWGREVMLYDCDDFTRKFYHEYLNIDQAEGRMDVSEKPVKHVKLQPPPHNGLGTEEDSLINCRMIQPKPNRPDLAKLMTFSGESLRFEAKMTNGEPEDECRRFVIAYFPDTDRVAVYELQSRNSGHMAGKFREKSRLKNPATGKWYQLSEFFVGATINIASQPLQIIRADEHALQYLESQPEEFPFANAMAVARRLRPVISEPEMQNEELDPDQLKELAASAGIYLVDHEIIALLRRFGDETDEGPVISGPRVMAAC